VPAPAAAAHGYALSFRIGAALLAAGALLVLVLLEHVIAQPRNPVAELTPGPSLTLPPKAPGAR
jgi:hypothetical protein